MKQGKQMTKKQAMKRKNAALTRAKKWRRKPKSQTKDKCFFREWVIERYGEKSACTNVGVEYQDCGQECHWVPTCPHCGKDIIKFIAQKIQDTSGRTLSQWIGACANQECNINKALKDVKEKVPDYYV